MCACEMTYYCSIYKAVAPLTAMHASKVSAATRVAGGQTEAQLATARAAQPKASKASKQKKAGFHNPKGQRKAQQTLALKRVQNAGVDCVYVHGCCCCCMHPPVVGVVCGMHMVLIGVCKHM